jgi:hypothetical protein
MKKIVCFTLLFLLINFQVNAQDSNLIDPIPALFPDVTTSNEFYSAIYYVKQTGIVNGYSDGSFKPDKTITRGEFTKIVIGSIYEETIIQSCDAKNVFTDLELNNSFTKYICIARLNNIISGFSDATFRPDSEIEFQAAAKILANSFSMEPDLSQVSDTDKLKPYIIRMGEKKAIPLTIKTREQKLTRGELAEMIFRIKTADTSKQSRVFEDFQPVSIQM